MRPEGSLDVYAEYLPNMSSVSLILTLDDHLIIR